MEAFEHTRPDGTLVRLTGPRWRLELRRDGKLTEVPQEWLVQHDGGARLVTLRKCAEPVTFGAELAADVMTVVHGMARWKTGELFAFETAVTEGRPVTLKNLLRGLDGRKLKGCAEPVTTSALCERVKRAEERAVAALDAGLVERLDAFIAAKKGGAA